MAPRPTTQPLGRQPAGAEETGEASFIKSVGGKKRYHILLRIRHPELDPDQITAALGWKPDRSWKAGEQSVTPKGTKLPTVRTYGLWSRTFRCRGEQRIVDQLNEILKWLTAHKGLFKTLEQSGAQAALYLQLPGDTNIGASIPWNVLKKFAHLKISFEFETFPKWA